MLFVSAVYAAELEASGGADVVAGVVHDPAAWTGDVHGQVEGGLLVRGGAVEAGAEIDVRAGVVPALGLSLVPERLDVGGQAGPVILRAGVAPAPWRVEQEDGWDTSAVTWSVEHRRVLPSSFLAAEVGFGDKDGAVSFLGGLDLGAGLNLLGDVGTQLQTAPLLVGVHGHLDGKSLSVNGGVLAWPDRPAVAGQAGAMMEFDAFTLQVQVVGGWNTAFGAHVEADILPDGIATPVLRAEVLGAQPGGAVGVRVRPVEWVSLKAEVGYADGAPQGWVEATAWAKTKPRARRSR